MNFADYGLSRLEYLCLLERVFCAHCPERKTFCFTHSGRERCNAMTCCKSTKLKARGQYYFCNTHLRVAQDILTKQDYIWQNLRAQVLSEVIKTQPLSKANTATDVAFDVKGLCRVDLKVKEDQRQITETDSLTGTKKERGQEIVKVHKTGKPIALKSVCAAQHCQKTKVSFCFRDLFCADHRREIAALRIFKRLQLPLEEEIALRIQELALRKKKDAQHEWYVKYLQGKLLQ